MSWTQPKHMTLGEYLEAAQEHESLKAMARGLNMNFSTMWNHLDRNGWLDEVKDALGSATLEGEIESGLSPDSMDDIDPALLLNPTPYGSDEYGDSLAWFQDVVKVYEAENGKLTRQLRKLRGQLYNQKRLRETLMEESRKALATKPLVRIRSSYTPETTNGSQEQWECHAPTADLHIGLYSWEMDSFGGSYDTDEACERLVRHGEEVAKWVTEQPGKCSRVYLTDLGDLFHSLIGHTENGTFLHQDTRATRVYRMTLEAKREQIEAVRQAVPNVVIMGAQGNHDWTLNMMFQSAIYGYYHQDSQVDVRLSDAKQCYFTSGTEDSYTVHFLDHGKGINQTFTPKSREDLDTTLKAMVPPAVRSGAIANIVYIGHLHHHAVMEHGDKEIIRLPSMSEPDDYETSLRLLSKPSAIIYRLDEQGCIHSSRRLYF